MRHVNNVTTRWIWINDFPNGGDHNDVMECTDDIIVNGEMTGWASSWRDLCGARGSCARGVNASGSNAANN